MTGDAVLDAVLTRRSVTKLTEPGPPRSELVELIQAAATAPDHGRIRPWRLILVEGHDRHLLGEALRDAATSPEQAHRAYAKPLRAPTLLSIVFCPHHDHPTVPQWEQLAAAASMIQTLHLLLHSRGWGAIWRTGAVVEAPQVRRRLDLTDAEQLLGWLYIGTPAGTSPAHPRDRVDITTKISSLGANSALPAGQH
jgi:nitroreductase